MKKIPDKWRFAIGTTSRVPDLKGFHYLIADFDRNTNPLCDPFVVSRISSARYIVLQRTEHGWHLYTSMILDFENLIIELRKMGADEVWIDIGKERGYYFLADKSEIDFPYPVEHMVIHYGKEKTQHSKKS